MPHGICAMQDMTFSVKCDERELLPGFTAEADQLELLSRSKTVTVPKVGQLALTVTTVFW
ncbi:putative kinase [Escherichia coli]|uniref:Putative kinase n=1 Tax=Escherichia coli TaxID=562 RepID=A0A377BA87_ECOLX|nr:putative kinase [Escherichia coli]